MVTIMLYLWVCKQWVPLDFLCIPWIAFPPLPLGTLDILECSYFYCYSGHPLLTLTLHLPLNCFLYCSGPSFVFPFQAEKWGGMEALLSS